MTRTCQLIALTLCLVAFNGSAHAKAKSTFISPMQFENGGYPVAMGDGVYERYNYPFFGAYLTVVTGLNQNPDDGDAWVLGVYDTYTYQIIGQVVLTYDRASDCILHQGTAVTCGHYVTEDDPKVVYSYFNIYFFGECLAVNGYELLGTTPENFEIWTFTPVRFKPQIETLSLAEAIRPTLQQSQGESTTVSLIVKDDLNCGRALKGVDVAFENFFVPGSGGHANITQESPITGYYTALQGSGGTVPATEQRSIIFEHPNPDKPPVVQHYTVAPKIEGKTNASGRFDARYTAGIFGGQERVVATANIPHLSQKDPAAEDASEKVLDIKVPGLAEMARIGEAHRFDKQPTCGSFEPDARWLTEKNRDRALELARLWYDWYGEKLSYNDASLVNGAVIEKLTIDKGCHQTHRRGVHIDINRLLNNLDGDCRVVKDKRVCRYDDLRTFGRWVELEPAYSSGVHFVGGE